MKANEAPKKVYLHLTTGNRLLNGEYYERKPAKIRVDDKIIEYIRTDAFIEKACDWMDEHCKLLTSKDYEDFRKYMKGE